MWTQNGLSPVRHCPLSGDKWRYGVNQNIHEIQEAFRYFRESNAPLDRFGMRLSKLYSANVTVKFYLKLRGMIQLDDNIWLCSFIEENVLTLV